jgi:hypothetical protein
MGVYTKTQEPVSEASSHRICFIYNHSSSGKGRVVIGPNHVPRVNIEHGTTRARRLPVHMPLASGYHASLWQCMFWGMVL